MNARDPAFAPLLASADDARELADLKRWRQEICDRWPALDLAAIPGSEGTDARRLDRVIGSLSRG